MPTIPVRTVERDAKAGIQMETARRSNDRDQRPTSEATESGDRRGPRPKQRRRDRRRKDAIRNIDLHPRPHPPCRLK